MTSTNLSTRHPRRGLPVSRDSFTSDDVDILITELRKTKLEVDIARGQFDAITDPLLIDHVVFRMGAAEKRFNYLFQLARKMNLTLNDVRWDWPEQA